MLFRSGYTCTDRELFIELETTYVSKVVTLGIKEKGVDATVVDLHTIRPLDTDLIEKVAARTGKVLVCENGRYAGGVGEMIAGHLSTVLPTKMAYLNVGERYGEVGNLSYLKEAFGFTADNIVNKVMGLLA